jgi:hypothetical protein
MKWMVPIEDGGQSMRFEGTIQVQTPAGSCRLISTDNVTKEVTAKMQKLKSDFSSQTFSIPQEGRLESPTTGLEDDDVSREYSVRSSH